MSNVVELVPFYKSCVTVIKFRGIDEENHEFWDRWCIAHHHWVNNVPALRLIETLGDS